MEGEFFHENGASDMPVIDEVTGTEDTVPRRRPFRRAVLHGLGVVLPPLLTIVVFLWAWNLISAYVLTPVENAARRLIVTAIWDVRTQKPEAARAGLPGTRQRRVDSA